MIRRKYKNKDVEMLIVAYTVVEAAIAHSGELTERRAMWASPFFDTLKGKVDDALQKFLGVDSAKSMRQSTLTVKALQKQILQELREIRVQISQDFKGTRAVRNEMLTQLGFTSYYKLARLGDLQALITLLYHFKMNLTEEVKVQILAGTGISRTSLDGTVARADKLINVNVQQESYKGFRRVVTQEAIMAFNEIYESVIKICIIAGEFFKTNVAIRAQFNYSKISAAITGRRKSDRSSDDSDTLDLPLDNDDPVI